MADITFPVGSPWGAFSAPCGTLADPFSHTQRILGTVLDPNGGRLSGAVVVLSNIETNTLRYDTADENGAYRFDGVCTAFPLEVWAELDGHRSSIEQVRRFSTTKTVHLDLQLSAT